MLDHVADHLAAGVLRTSRLTENTLPLNTRSDLTSSTSPLRGARD
jgi:hypothetical protein